MSTRHPGPTGSPRFDAYGAGPGTFSAQRRRRRQNRIAIAIALVVLLVVACGWFGYNHFLVQRKDYSGTGDGSTVLVRVDEGDSISSLAPELLSKDVIASRRALMTAAEARTDTSQLKSGYYALQRKMSASAALDALLVGASRCGVVDVPPSGTLEDFHIGTGGQTRDGIFTLIAKGSCANQLGTSLTAESLQQAAATASLDDLGVPSWAREAVASMGQDPRRLEGLIFAGQHLFDPTATPTEILKSMITESARSYAGAGLSAAAKSVGLTEYQILIGASLVEKEASDQYFGQIARVLLNRLGEHMKLEFDSTVYYGLNEAGVAITDEQWAADTPWNTYAHEGLPATPIATPSLSAVHAMENPTPGDWLYFVTIDRQGTTVFNRDFGAHEAAVRQAQEGGALDNPNAPQTNH